MKLVKLTSVSHIFEGEMIKDMLSEMNIQVYLADQNTPEHMDIYLGYEGDGVLVLVDEANLEEAKSYLSSAEEQTDGFEYTEDIKFPHWIWIGFLLMLTIFIVYNIVK